jgi:hypothetical protein
LLEDIIEVLCQLLVGFVIVDAAYGFVESEKGSAIMFRDVGLVALLRLRPSKE